jgi:hypothetical protein
MSSEPQQQPPPLSPVPFSNTFWGAILVAVIAGLILLFVQLYLQGSGTSDTVSSTTTTTVRVAASPAAPSPSVSPARLPSLGSEPFEQADFNAYVSYIGHVPEEAFVAAEARQWLHGRSVTASDSLLEVVVDPRLDVDGSMVRIADEKATTELGRPKGPKLVPPGLYAVIITTPGCPQALGRNLTFRAGHIWRLAVLSISNGCTLK